MWVNLSYYIGNFKDEMGFWVCNKMEMRKDSGGGWLMRRGDLVLGGWCYGF